MLTITGVTHYEKRTIMSTTATPTVQGTDQDDWFPGTAGDDRFNAKDGNDAALEPAWVLNGAVYAVAMSAFRANHGPAFLFGRQAAIPMPTERSADIDTAFDFALAEAAATITTVSRLT